MEMIDGDASIFGTNELERNLIKLDWCDGRLLLRVYARVGASCQGDTIVVLVEREKRAKTLGLAALNGKSIFASPPSMHVISSPR